MFRTILVHHQEQLYKLYIAFGICRYMPVPYVWLLCGYSHTRVLFILLVYIHIVGWCTVHTTSDYSHCLLFCGHQNWWRLLSFGNFTPCILWKVFQYFRGTYCLHLLPYNGGSKLLRNCDQFLQSYTAPYLRNRHLHSHCRYAFKYRTAFTITQCVCYWSQEYTWRQ